MNKRLQVSLAFMLTILASLFTVSANADPVFSMKDVDKTQVDLDSKKSADVKATFVNGKAEVYNGKSSAATLIKSTGEINLSGSSASYLHITLTDGEFAAGMKISVNTQDGAKKLKVSAQGDGKNQEDVAFPYTIPTGSSLVGKKELYVFKSGLTAFAELTIEASQGVKLTYDLSQPADGIKVKAKTENIELAKGATVSTAIDTWLKANEATNYKGIETPGYKFDIIGIPANDRMPEGVLEVSAAYVPKTFKYTYKYSYYKDWGTAEQAKSGQADDIKTQEDNAEYGSPITKESTPATTGYEFIGYSLNGAAPVADFPKATMPAENTEITAIMNALTYTIKYNLDGGKEETTQGGLLYNQPVTFATPKNPDKRAFSDWTFYTQESVDKAPTDKSKWVKVDMSSKLMPAQNLYAEGSLKYQVTFTVDAVTFDTKEFFYGENTIKAADPEAKEGYTFTGWAGLPETMPAEDLNCAAEYTANPYTLTYTVDGKETKKATLVYGQEVTDFSEIGIITPDEAKKGYTFSGWDKSQLVEKDGQYFMPASDATLSGVKRNKYNITYYLDGEEYAPNTQKDVKFDDKIKLGGEPPVVEGKTFSGWVAYDGDTEIAFPEKMPNYDITVKGGYSYTITYMKHKLDEKGKPTEEIVKHDSKTYFAGQAINLGDIIDPTNPEKYDLPDYAKYNFSWNGMPEDGKMPAENITVYALYSPKAVTVTYTVDDKVVPELTQEFPWGTDILPLLAAEPEPRVATEAFSGWSIGGKAVSEYKKYVLEYDNPVTVTGQYGYKLTVTYYAEDGKEIIGTSDFVEACPINYDKVPEKTGNTVEWMVAEKDKDGKYVATKTAAPVTATEDQVVIAKASKNTYHINYFKDNSEIAFATKNFEYDKELKSLPAKIDGCTEWMFFVDDKEQAPIAELPKNMPAYNIIAKAYTYYKATYTALDKSYQTRDYYYTQEIPEEEWKFVEGYKFNGWDYAAATPIKDKDENVIGYSMPKDNITIPAKLAKYYTVKYFVNGEELKEQTVSVAAGDKFEALNIEGFAVDGWYSDKTMETLAVLPGDEYYMPEADLVLYGSAEVLEFDLTFFDADGNEFAATKVEYGKSVVIPDGYPVKNGYTFNGWKWFNEDAEEIAAPATMPAYNVYAVAQYTANEYTLTLMIDGEVWKAVKIATDTDLNKLLEEEQYDPKKDEKYTDIFVGWDSFQDLMPARDYVIKATTKNPSAINGVAADNKFADVVAWYTVDGKRLEAPVQGALNIAKMSDGTMKKIMVK